MLPRDRERLQSLTTKALLLAAGGAHQNWRSIELTLVQSGRVDAPRILGDLKLRAKLDEACNRARPKRAREMFGLVLRRGS